MMMKLCAACEKLYIEAKFSVEPERDIPEGNGKCDCCRKRRWVKSVYVRSEKK